MQIVSTDRIGSLCNLYDPYETLAHFDKVIAKMRKYMENMAYRDVIFGLKFDYDDESVEIEVSYKREEDEWEIAQRERSEERSNRFKEQQERETLERLKAKYET